MKRAVAALVALLPACGATLEDQGRACVRATHRGVAAHRQEHETEHAHQNRHPTPRSSPAPTVHVG